MSTRYLDAASTAPLAAEAREAMGEVYDEGQANASSVHGPGFRAGHHVEVARQRVATFFGVRPSEVIFTSGGTEANNLALTGLALAHPRGRHLLTTPLEHPSVLQTCRYLERVLGFELELLPVDGTGRVDPDAVSAALRPDTTLVSVGLANGEVGTVQPIAEIAAIVRETGALMHTDAVQAAASLPLNFADDSGAAVGAGAGAGTGQPPWPGPIDAVTVAAHKLGGPHGAGALLLRSGIEIEPLLHGGGQEGGRRSGTENVAAIAGFGAAAHALQGNIGTRALALAENRDRFAALVCTELPTARLTGHPTERLPGHASFVVPGHSGESMLVALDTAGFAVSSGSACAAGKNRPSPALLALGLTEELAMTSLRFTLADSLSDTDMRRITEVLRRETAR